MVRAFISSPIIIILALLPGCISGPALQTEVRTSPGKRLEIYGVRIYQRKKGVLVMGSVRRPMLFHRTDMGTSPCRRSL